MFASRDHQMLFDPLQVEPRMAQRHLHDQIIVIGPARLRYERAVQPLLPLSLDIRPSSLAKGAFSPFTDDLNSPHHENSSDGDARWQFRQPRRSMLAVTTRLTVVIQQAAAKIQARTGKNPGNRQQTTKKTIVSVPSVSPPR
jgi:hypothetical protein